MHLTELSSNQVGRSGRRGHSAGLGHDAHNTRSLPRHFKLSTHQQGAAQSYYDAAKDTLYVSKSIALICQLPYVYAARKYLRGLHRWEPKFKSLFVLLITSPGKVSCDLLHITYTVCWEGCVARRCKSETWAILTLTPWPFLFQQLTEGHDARAGLGISPWTSVKKFVFAS